MVVAYPGYPAMCRFPASPACSPSVSKPAGKRIAGLHHWADLSRVARFLRPIYFFMGFTGAPDIRLPDLMLILIA